MVGASKASYRGCWAEVNTKEEEGETALIAATYRGHIDIVKALLEAGADLNARDKNGKTALTYAEEKSHSETV